jgi:hypothetical protein
MVLNELTNEQTVKVESEETESTNQKSRKSLFSGKKILFAVEIVAAGIFLLLLAYIAKNLMSGKKLF